MALQFTNTNCISLISFQFDLDKRPSNENVHPSDIHLTQVIISNNVIGRITKGKGRALDNPKKESTEEDAVTIHPSHLIRSIEVEDSPTVLY